jgi:hypothetical protein
MGKMRNVDKVLVGEHEWKIPLGRPRYRWEDNIRMDLRKMGWDGADWMHLTQDRDQWLSAMNTVLNLRVL